jgi:hypothetical protein
MAGAIVKNKNKKGVKMAKIIVANRSRAQQIKVNFR